MKIENSDLKKISFEKCITKKDENNDKTNNIKIKYENENLYIECYDVLSFGLVKKENYFYFPICFKKEHEDFINNFQKLAYFLKNEVNTRRLFPKKVGGRHYHKFSPLKEKTETTDEILFLKIGYNPKTEKVFTNFYDKFSRKVCYEHLINTKLSCDICIKIDSIFANKNGDTYLNCNLYEATVEKEKRRLISREKELIDDDFCIDCSFFYEDKKVEDSSSSSSVDE